LVISKEATTYLYVVPFLFYLLIPALLSLTFDQYVTYAVKTIFMSILLLFLAPRYKLNRRNMSAFAIPVGIVIIAIWILIDPYYPHLGASEYNPLLTENLIYFQFLIKFMGMVFVAAFIEELFVRAFLNRVLINPSNWEAVPHGKFTALSFIMTILFFGFAHYRWLAGLISGTLFNLIYYKTKNIESCILAHAAANSVLFIYVALASSWGLW
jgi:CAAX prenyl protease-like protein